MEVHAESERFVERTSQRRRVQADRPRPAGFQMFQGPHQQGPPDPRPSVGLLHQQHRDPADRAELTGRDRPDDPPLPLGDEASLPPRARNRRQSASTWFQPASAFNRIPSARSAAVIGRRSTIVRLTSSDGQRHQDPAQEPKSKRTSAPSSFRRASKGLPDFDSNPLSSGLRPSRRSDLGRADADLLAGDRLPDREPAALPSSRCSRRTSPARRPRTRRGDKGRARPAAKPVGRSRGGAAAGRAGCRFLRRAVRGAFRPPAGGRPAFAAGRLGPPVGTGISVTSPESVRWRITSPAPSIVSGPEQDAPLQELADLLVPERAALVLPPEDERAALPPAGAAEPPLPLDHRAAAARAVAEPARVDRGRVAGADDLAGVPGDLRHEPARVQAAALDLAELRLPLARQLRALQAPVLDERHEVAAQVRRGQRLLLPRDVAPRQQGLDDRRPRRRRAQAPAP